tara:strand:+ start:756 stop:950 length:195 start_codon:yes stop_codon:yes gene_type:complete
MNVEEDEGLNVKYRFRITILRASGSVWVEDYKTIPDMLEGAGELIAQYPHIVLSKQRIVMQEDE